MAYSGWGSFSNYHYNNYYNDDYYDDDDDEYYDDDDDDEYYDDYESSYDDESGTEYSHTSVTVEKDIGWAIRNQDEYPEYFSHQLATLKPEWTVFYTDASWSEWEDYMGLAWICPALEKVTKIQVSSEWTSNQGEAMAIVMALEYIKNSTIQKAIICSDSLGTLESLEYLEDNNYADDLVWDIQICCDELDKMGKKIEFWWCPGHMGIEGNEQADEAAEDARFNGDYIDYDDDDDDDE